MWLIDVLETKLKEAKPPDDEYDNNVDSERVTSDRYIALSHTWEDEEVTYQDFKGDLSEARKEKRASQKSTGHAR